MGLSLQRSYSLENKSKYQMTGTSPFLFDYDCMLESMVRDFGVKDLLFVMCDSAMCC